MKLAITFLLVLIIPAAEWLNDLDTAKNIATQEHKYILLNFSGSDWCAPCIKMKKEVFESPSFVSFAEKHLVLVRADFPRSKKNMLSKEQSKYNEALAERYNPNGKFPYTILLDANGNVVKAWDGYQFGSQEKFLADLQQAPPFTK